MSEIKTENIWFKSSYQEQPVAAYLFSDPQAEPHAILQITHGMAEYLLRYRPFAEYMAQHGYIVCGHDDLGHGNTSGTTHEDGFFAPKNGRHYVLQDIRTMNETVRARYPDLPVVLFGHSMGSYFARWYAVTYPETIEGAVFCGTGGKNPAAGAAILMTDVIGLFRGPAYKSKFIDKLAFGSYLEKIPDAKTPFDWLSVNTDNVQRYIADPKCGFLFSVSGFHEMTKVVQEVNSARWVENFSKALPVLVMAGREDPVGSYGKGPEEVARRLREAGVQDVSLKLYDGMRHEVLNETGHEAVWQDVLVWCEHAVHAAQPAPQA